MKKTGLFLLWLFLGSMLVQASELVTYTDAYIWGQAGRNNSRKGSALATSTGETYSLTNVLSKTDTNDIDVLCFFGKVGKKGDKTFILFGPGNPTLKMDWTPKTGTRPYCDVIASKGGETDEEASLRGWDVRNETKMQRASIDFASATYETIAGMTMGNTYLVNEVKVGDVIAFETAATSANPGKKGLILVKAIEDDPERPDKIGEGSYQKLILDIKVMK